MAGCSHALSAPGGAESREPAGGGGGRWWPRGRGRVVQGAPGVALPEPFVPQRLVQDCVVESSTSARSLGPAEAASLVLNFGAKDCHERLLDPTWDPSAL